MRDYSFAQHNSPCVYTTPVLHMLRVHLCTFAFGQPMHICPCTFAHTVPVRRFGSNQLRANKAACYISGGDGIIGHDSFIAVCTLIFVAVLSLMIVLYAKIFLHIKAVFNKVGPGNDKIDDKAKEKAKESKAKEKAIMVQFIVITMFFLSCWTVLALIWIANIFGFFVYNQVCDTIVSFGCHSCSMGNPIIYGVMNKKLRNAMFDTLPSWLGDVLYSKTYGKEKLKTEKVTSQIERTKEDSDLSEVELTPKAPARGVP